MPDTQVIVKGEITIRWQESADVALHERQRHTVDEIWQRALAGRGNALHDSPLLVFRRIEGHGTQTTVIGEYLPYRYYYARTVIGDAAPSVSPIGVNGLLYVKEERHRNLVLGRRSSTVAWYPGCWECVPSGGLDRRCARADGTVDFAAMLLEEFTEELCLPAETARVGPAFGFLYDPATWTYDVCCRMEAFSSPAELKAAVARSGEYSELLFLADDEIDDTVRRLGAELIPTARAMIELSRTES